MADLSAIKHELRRTREQKEEAYARARALEQREEKLESALEILRELGVGNGEGASVNGGVLADADDLTLQEAAVVAYRHMGEPAGAPELASFMLNEGYPYTRSRDTLATSLRGTLSRGMGEGGPFVKVKRGVYGLQGRDDPEDDDQGDLMNE